MKNTTSETNPGFIPPVSNSGSRLKKYEGAVDVPVGDRRWTGHLVEIFRDLDPSYQRQITDLIGGLAKENPERAKEIARQIGDFFSGIGKTQRLDSFLEGLKQEINRSKTTLN